MRFVLFAMVTAALLAAASLADCDLNRFFDDPVRHEPRLHRRRGL